MTTKEYNQMNAEMAKIFENIFGFKAEDVNKKVTKTVTKTPYGTVTKKVTVEEDSAVSRNKFVSELIYEYHVTVTANDYAKIEKVVYGYNNRENFEIAVKAILGILD